MATIVAQATGNWSAGATWTGGVKPGVGDIAQTGAFVVTIDEDVTCTQLEPTSTGNFSVLTARTINANIVHSGTIVFTGGLSCGHTSGSTVTINGNVSQPSTTGNARAINNTSTGALVINGDITGAAGGGVTVYSNSTGPITVTGNVTGGSAATAYGISVNSTATINIVGNVVGGSASTAYGVYVVAGGTVIVTGNVTGAVAAGVYNNAAGSITVSGTACGGTAANSYGVVNNGTGTVSCLRAKGGSAPNTPGLWGNNSGGVTTWKEAETGTNGTAPFGGFNKMVVDQGVNTIIVKRSDTGSDYALSNDYPVVADVREGVVYKLASLTGTYSPTMCDYPAVGDVRLGTSYDSGGSTGTLDLPAVADVQAGVTFDGATKTGTFAAPAVGDVQSGVTYGAAAEYTGTLALPTEAQVEEGVGYGAGGVEFTGALVATGAADWTAGEKEQIRQALGVTGTTAATTGTGTLEAAFAALADDTDIAAAVLAAAVVAPISANVTMQAGVLIPGPLALESTAQAILEDTGTTLPAQIAGVGAGSGTGYYSDTVNNGVTPLDGVRVQLYTAANRVGLAYEAFTNALGVFEMWPDPGTYRVWFDLAGYSFPEDTLVEVTEP